MSLFVLIFGIVGGSCLRLISSPITDARLFGDQNHQLDESASKL